jgi:hypothetical protein
LALVLYIAALLVMLQRSTGPLARMLWTAACLLYLAHVAAAFHFVHGWSHQAAYLDTARQTEALLGVRYGGGLYWNYVFTLLWSADVAWWWYSPAGYRNRDRRLQAGVHGFLAFMFFQATVVFGRGLVRLFGVAAGSAVLLAWAGRNRGAVRGR